MRTARVVLSLVVVCSALAACSRSGGNVAQAPAADEPNRYKAAGFSFVPPDGWQLRELPGLKYKIAAANPEDGFAPNVNVVDEEFGGSLETYSGESLKMLQKTFANFQNLGQEDFTTTGGLGAKKITTTSLQNNTPMRQVFYLFPGNGRFFVLTCSDLSSHNGRNDAACDSVAKSFRVG